MTSPSDLMSWAITIGSLAIGASFVFTGYVHRNAQSEREKITAAWQAAVAVTAAEWKSKTEAITAEWKGALHAITALRERDAEIRERDIATLHDRLNATNKEFYEFRINAAQLFATITAVAEFRKEVMSGMRDFRTEFMTSMKEIEDRLDRIANHERRLDHTPGK